MKTNKSSRLKELSRKGKVVQAAGGEGEGEGYSRFKQ